jgi:hypothetical protein
MFCMFFYSCFLFVYYFTLLPVTLTCCILRFKCNLDLLCLLLQMVSNDPVFSSLCSVVDHQILVVQWCKSHGHRYSLNNRDFLDLTLEHSTLEVLRRTASLEDLELNEASMLLLSNNEQGNVMTFIKAFLKFCIFLCVRFSYYDYL